MITRILLAVDDSPGALAAARIAVDLAAHLGARLRVVNVVQDGRLAETLEAASGSPGLTRAARLGGRGPAGPRRGARPPVGGRRRDLPA